MKKTLFHLFLALSFAQTLNAQVVNIPDASFKNVLLQDMYINTNRDNEIQVNEAVTYSYSIDIDNKGVKDLTGIEAFINIKSLYCDYNQLTTLNISKNIALNNLYCSYNQLTNLDVSKNIALIKLRCDHNQLTNLDLSKNIKLDYLYCGKNQLSNLDLSKNIELTSLYCFFNQLTQYLFEL